MTIKPKASDDPEIHRLREKIDDLRVKLSLAFDSDQIANRELVDLQRKIDVLNQAIVIRIRDLETSSDPSSHY